MNSIAIVGAGISGLTAALRCSRIAKNTGVKTDIQIFEVTDRHGGRIYCKKAINK